MTELFRALAALAEPPGPEQARLGEILRLPGVPVPEDHTELFLLQLYPYSSIYLGEEGMLGGEARDRVAGFWRALGLVPPAEPDHLTVLLAAYATLSEVTAPSPAPSPPVPLTRMRERGSDSDVGEAMESSPQSPSSEVGGGTRGGGTGGPADERHHARRAFFWEHLACWLPPYLARVVEIASPFYRSWAELLHSALIEEARCLGPPRSLPLQLRAAPQLPDLADLPRDELLRSLLAPVRSGVILTRCDLARAARELALGMRVGERLFIARHLLEQEPQAMLAWLAGEARRQGERLAAGPPPLAPIASFWTARAEATAAALADLHLSPVTPP